MIFAVCLLAIRWLKKTDSAADLLSEKNPGFKSTKINLKTLANSSTYFIFQGKFYDHIDVAMGSPLRPVLANRFKGIYEQK